MQQIFYLAHAGHIHTDSSTTGTHALNLGFLLTVMAAAAVITVAVLVIRNKRSVKLNAQRATHKERR